MIMKDNVVNSVSVEMQGAYGLFYTYEDLNPILCEHNGGGEEYIIAHYNGETYYYEEECGWYQENVHGERTIPSEEIEYELYELCGYDYSQLIEEYTLNLIVEMLPDFLKENNLEIYFENNSDSANLGTYYVCDMDRDIKDDKENWRKVEEDEYYKIAQFIPLIIGDEIIRYGYQTLEHPEYEDLSL